MKAKNTSAAAPSTPPAPAPVEQIDVTHVRQPDQHDEDETADLDGAQRDGEPGRLLDPGHGDRRHHRQQTERRHPGVDVEK